MAERKIEISDSARSKGVPPSEAAARETTAAAAAGGAQEAASAVSSAGTEEARVAVEMAALARRARAASKRVAALSPEARVSAVRGLADAVESASDAIVAANREDLEAAERNGLTGPMVDRLRMDAGGVAKLARAIREVAAQPDPVGEVAESWERPNGLRVERVRIPLGVLLMIYESRPNVTADAASLCLMAGNAVILRGGSEAFHTNRAIADALRGALETAGVTPDAIQLVGTTDRRAVDALLRQEESIDLVIPRGGEGLIRAVVEKSRIPVLKHYKGVCHIYVDGGADLEQATAIVLNAKVQRPGVCNALETLLVDDAIADRALPVLARALEDAGVELRGCERTREILEREVIPATEDDWYAEYLDLILAVRVVDDLEAAVAHVARYGSGHSEAIVTRSREAARRFQARVDAAAVYVNASTRFTDGFVFGFGAEIGISTQKLHARGPMGLDRLVTSKYLVDGDGQVRG